MSNYWGKQPSSRIILTNNVAWTGTGTAVSTTFSAQTRQVRVASPVNGWLNIDITGLSSTPTTAGGIGVFIGASVQGEYFAVSPSQILSFSSTSTSSGSVAVSEMA